MNREFSWILTISFHKICCLFSFGQIVISKKQLANKCYRKYVGILSLLRWKLLWLDQSMQQIKNKSGFRVLDLVAWSCYQDKGHPCTSIRHVIHWWFTLRTICFYSLNTLFLKVSVCQLIPFIYFSTFLCKDIFCSKE